MNLYSPVSSFRSKTQIISSTPWVLFNVRVSAPHLWDILWITHGKAVGNEGNKIPGPTHKAGFVSTELHRVRNDTLPFHTTVSGHATQLQSLSQRGDRCLRSFRFITVWFFLIESCEQLGQCTDEQRLEELGLSSWSKQICDCTRSHPSIQCQALLAMMSRGITTSIQI